MYSPGKAPNRFFIIHSQLIKDTSTLLFMIFKRLHLQSHQHRRRTFYDKGRHVAPGLHYCYISTALYVENSISKNISSIMRLTTYFTGSRFAIFSMWSILPRSSHFAKAPHLFWRRVELRKCSLVNCSS